jgi:transcription termination/antitermination protein NusA
MAKRSENRNIDFTNSSVRGPRGAAREDDGVSEDALDRLEQVTGGAEQPLAHRGNLARETNKLNASTEEEVDALRVNLAQDNDSMHNTRYGTGMIADDVAREHMAGITEVGRELDDKGANSVVPGRDNTSSVLRRHHPNTEIARAQDVIEGNLEQPREESRTDRKVDEGTAA